MGRGDDFETLSGIFVHSTDKAVLIDFGTGEEWVPLSVLSEDSRDEVENGNVARGDTLDVEIRKWFVEKASLL